MLWLWPRWSSGVHLLALGAVSILPGCPAQDGRSVRSTFQNPTRPRAQLTALDGVRRSLQGDDPSAGLRNVHPENQPHPCVLPADVRLPLPQLDVSISELQDPRTVDAAGRLETPLRAKCLREQERSPTKTRSSVKQSNSTASDREKKQNKTCNTLISISAKNLHPEKGNTQGGGIPQWKLLLWGDISHADFSTLKSV